MKSIYESLLDDQDDIIGKAENNDEVKKKAGEGWLKNHGVGIHTLSRDHAMEIVFGSFKGMFTGIDDMSAEYVITKKDTDANIPELIPPVLHVRKFYVKGFLGKEIPDRLVPRMADVVMIANCPNLTRLPQLPNTVDTFSVVGCPKLVSLDGCPQEVNHTFKVADNGREFDWKDIHRACPKLVKQKAVY